MMTLPRHDIFEIPHGTAPTSLLFLTVHEHNITKV